MKESKHCYIKITKDKYEHITAIADTAQELAKQCNTNVNVIYSSVSHGWGCFKKVSLEENERSSS